MEGYEGGAWSQLDGNAQAAWHFSCMADGRVFQHYPIDQSPWHAGNKAGNVTLIGIEHEGVAGEALTPQQLAASKALVSWLAAECGWVATRAPGSRTLYEHNEIGTTTCPNGRIPWLEYEPQTAPAPVTYPVPEAYLEWRGKGESEWVNEWTLRLVTNQPAPNVQTIYEGPQADGEHYKIRVEDWKD